MSPRSFSAFVAAVLLPALAGVGRADDEFERPPIEYSRATPDNCVSQLQARLDAGQAKLDYTAEHGYLPSLLALLDAPVESQTLVFSQTSLQRDRISPRTPRALYFNDEVYVGFCQAGEVLEISVADPLLGTVFYSLDQRQEERPRFVRQTDNCLACHSSSRTEGVPGHTVRSLFVGGSGQPIFSAGSHTVDHTTPLDKRWGGWYVTGKHGDQTHLGNLVIRTRDVPQPVDNAEGQNVTDLSGRFAVEKYLSPYSDLVALMVLEHQTFAHNRLTKANFSARQALFYEAGLNKALGDPPGTRLESTTRRLKYAGDDLIDALLFVDEAPLTAPLQGVSGFAEKFAQRGPRDARGRSLREFDLQRRIFKYPCSYLIYSPSFDKLPDELRAYVWQRLWEILVQDRDAQKYAHLSPADRRAIVEILRDTKRDLPDYWREA